MAPRCNMTLGKNSQQPSGRQYSSVGKALEWEPGDVGSNPSPAPSQLCDLGEITLPLHLRSWPENEEFGVMIWSEDSFQLENCMIQSRLILKSVRTQSSHANGYPFQNSEEKRNFSLNLPLVNTTYEVVQPSPYIHFPLLCPYFYFCKGEKSGGRNKQ